LVKKSNKRSREQLKIILKKWEKRILFVDKLYRAGKNTSNGFIPKEEKQEDAERLNKHIRTRPEPLLYYLYRSGQLKDLTKKDIKGINEWVKTKRREDPFCNVREIK